MMGINIKYASIILALFGTLSCASLTPIHTQTKYLGYHWARQETPFVLQIGNNLEPRLHIHLQKAVNAWSKAEVLNIQIVPGLAQRGEDCKHIRGRIGICNKDYGKTGWLGIAYTMLDSNRHITSVVLKMNDYYFNNSYYDTDDWRVHNLCHEIGHSLGLAHDDEVHENRNTGTCMDYTSNPSREPNDTLPSHDDYVTLLGIYQHIDSYTTISTNKDHHKNAGNSMIINVDWVHNKR